MLHELIRREKDATRLTWDEVREQRLLTRILGASGKVRERRRPRLVLRVAAAAAVLLVSLAGGWHLWSSRAPAVATVAAPVAPPSEHELTLADGSRLIVGGQTPFELAEQGPERVLIQQGMGRIVYDVMPNHARTFQVSAGAVQIVVRGTRFEVTRDEAHVEVRVERGRVEVDDGQRQTLLSAGESVTVRDLPPPPQDAAGKAGAGSEVPHSPPAVTPQGPGPGELEEQADERRRSGDLTGAKRVLLGLVARFPSDPRVPTAYFTLGRLEAQTGNPAAAANYFQQCRRRAGGALAEDALAEELQLRQQLGDRAAARSLAELYVARYPKGAHRRWVDGILSETPSTP